VRGGQFRLRIRSGLLRLERLNFRHPDRRGVIDGTELSWEGALGGIHKGRGNSRAFLSLTNLPYKLGPSSRSRTVPVGKTGGGAKMLHLGCGVRKTQLVAESSSQGSTSFRGPRSWVPDDDDSARRFADVNAGNVSRL